MISLTYVRISNFSHGTADWTTGFCSAFNFINTTENRDTPPLMHENFRYRSFSETKKGSPRNFLRYCDSKNFRRKIVIPFAQNIEISGGIHVCRKPLKTRLKTLVSFLTVSES